MKTIGRLASALALALALAAFPVTAQARGGTPPQLRIVFAGEIPDTGQWVIGLSDGRQYTVMLRHADSLGDGAPTLGPVYGPGRLTFWDEDRDCWAVMP